MAKVQLAFSILLYALGGMVVGLALYPGVLLTASLWNLAAGWSMNARLLMLSLGLGLGYFLYGFTLLIVTAALHTLFALRLRAGEHPYFSAESLKWVLASSLGLVVKVTFMDFLVLTPFLTSYFRMMGARLGHGVLINSKYVHDVSLLEIGDHTVVGGDAVISCHVAEGNRIKLRPVRIGKGCMIGQRAIIMPGVEIGDGAVIGAQALVLKGTQVPAGATWAGIPAAPLHHHS